MFVSDMDNDNYYEFEKFGKEYPKNYYLRQENTIYMCYNAYYQMAYTYTDNWIEGEERRSIMLYGLNYVNYDNDVTRDSKSGDGLCLTQTLFNEDANYEYLHFPISSYTAREPYGPMCENGPNCREKYGTTWHDGCRSRRLSFRAQRGIRSCQRALAAHQVPKA